MMFGSKVLEVGIGLALVFLLVSIIATAGQEGIEAIVKRRARDLQAAVGELVQGDAEVLKNFYAHPLVFALYQGRERPSYIPGSVFSAAITDMIETGERLPDKVRQAYDALERLSGGDAVRRRKELEDWYDGAMDRASGWFKRRTQTNLFFIGLGAAVLLNINAVTIAQYLNTSDAQRAQVIGAAGMLAAPGSAPAGTFDTQLAEALHVRLAEIGLPIGWSGATRRWMFPTEGEPIASGVLVAAGWLITALAAMLGAPFWFDVLNRLMVIRSTVKPKEKSPDERSEDSGPSAAVPASHAASTPERDRGSVADQRPIYG